MRKIVFQMMTTLNGRLDDPMAWVHGVSDDQYRQIDRIYAAYDTVLVGRTTYEEMAAYWPGALTDRAGTETNQKMAQWMNDCRKLVLSRSGREKLADWNNTEQVVVRADDELTDFLTGLKARPAAISICRAERALPKQSSAWASSTSSISSCTRRSRRDWPGSNASQTRICGCCIPRPTKTASSGSTIWLWPPKTGRSRKVSPTCSHDMRVDHLVRR